MVRCGNQGKNPPAGPGASASLHGLGQAQEAQPGTDPLLLAPTRCARQRRKVEEAEQQVKRQHSSAFTSPLPAVQGTVLLCAANRDDGPQGWQKISLAALPSPGPAGQELPHGAWDDPAALCLGPSRHEQAPGAGAVPGTRCPAMAAASQQNPAVPRSSAGAGGSVPAPCPHAISRLCWDVAGGRTLVTPGALVGLWRAAE